MTLVVNLRCASPESAEGQSALSDRAADAKAHLRLDDLTPLPQAPTRRTDGLEPLTERAQRALEHAAELRAERRFTEATLELEKALRFAPNDPRVHRELAITLWAAGDVGRVQTHLDALLEASDDDLVAHHLLGRLAARRFENPEAIRQFRTALLCSVDDDTRDYVALTEYHLAETLLAEGYLVAALETYQRFGKGLQALPADLALTPELDALRRAVPHTALERMSTVWAKLGKFDKAAECFHAAFPDGAMRTADRKRYANLLLNGGQLDAALAETRRVIVDDLSALDLLTEIHRRRGSESEVIDDLRKLADAHPANTDLVLALAQAYNRAGERDQARALLRERTASESVDPAIRWACFDLLVENGDWTEALAQAAAAIRANPEAAAEAALRIATSASANNAPATIAATDHDYATAFLQGVWAQSHDADDDAIAQYQQCLAAEPQFVPARERLGNLHLKRYAWDQAIAVAAPSDVTLPDDSRLATILGKAHVGLNQNEPAVEQLRKAVRLNRANTDALYALAEALGSHGERNRAIQQLEALLEVDSLDQKARELLFRIFLGGDDFRSAARQLDELKSQSASPTLIARCTASLEFKQGVADSKRFREILEEAIRSYRPDAATLQLIALSLLQEREYAQAVERLEQAFALEPDYTEAADSLVVAYHYNLQFDEALAQRRLLIQRYPNNLTWREEEVELLFILQRFDEVITTADAWLARADVEDPVVEWIRDTKIIANLLKEDYPAALAIVEAAREKEPASAYLLRQAIEINQRMGNHGRALELIRRWPKDIPDGFAAGAVSRIWRDLPPEQYAEVVQLVLDNFIAPANHDAVQVTLIDLLSATHDYDGAIELAESQAKVSRFAEVYDELRIHALNAAGRVQETIELVRERMLPGTGDRDQSRPIPYDYRELLVQLLIKAGDYGQAEKEVNRWLADLADPDQPAIDPKTGFRRGENRDERIFYLNLLSVIHQQTQNVAEGLEALELVLELDPDGAGASNDLGYTLADAGRELPRAEKLVRYAVADQPRNSAFLDSLGWVRYQRGDFAAAKLWLTRSRFAGAGRDPVVCDHLADTCWRLGDREAARKWWNQSIEFAQERLADEWPMPLTKRTLAAVQAKLEAARAGEEPAVAPFAGDAPAP